MMVGLSEMVRAEGGLLVRADGYLAALDENHHEDDVSLYCRDLLKLDVMMTLHEAGEPLLDMNYDFVVFPSPPSLKMARQAMDEVVLQILGHFPESRGTREVGYWVKDCSGRLQTTPFEP